MNVRLFGTANDSIVDGPGLRCAIFTQGCPHRCEGCHNPASHDPNGGYEADTADLIASIKRNPLLDGVTFSGGEPFLQAKPLTHIAKEAHARGLNTMAYTGYTWEELLAGATAENGWLAFLRELDLLVDGRFVLEERSIELQFKGSKNQRIIDVPQSLAQGHVVLSVYDI